MGKNRKFVGNEPEHKEEKVIEPVVETKVEETIEEVDAVVDGVQMNLNVRKEPKVAANNQIGILAKGTKVIVMKPKEPIHANGEHWFKIKFGKPEQEGYAMKKYIRIL